MRFVRRASVLLSLALIVAIAVGYVARQAGLASERDQNLTIAAELGSARLEGLIEATELASRAGADPVATSDLLAGVVDGVGVCAVDRVRVACAGEEPLPSDSSLDARLTARREWGESGDGVATVFVAGTDLVIDVVGPDLSLVVMVPAGTLGGDTTAVVSGSTSLPSPVGEFVDDDGVRQTVARVEGRDSLYVAALSSAAVTVPAEEQRFIVTMLTLSVVLLILAGVTMWGEQRRLVERASVDQLTRLPNRSEFERRVADMMAHAERHEYGVCLLLFDLNGFKRVNDVYGHKAGDEVLKVAGARIRKAVRGGDLVARWGGDEFVVAMEGVEDAELGERRARQLAGRIAGQMRLENTSTRLVVSVSVGVAIWPYHAETLGGLVEAADAAMYHAKRHGVAVASAQPLGAASLTPIEI